MTSTPLDTTRALVEALRDPDAYPHEATQVEVLETHISFILLAGHHAYKILKPVDLGFLDFSTLARRREDCERALLLNRRFNSRLYREVVPITGTPDHPRIGGREAVLEYALHMERFDPACTLDRRIERQPPPRPAWDDFARRLGEIHAGLPRAPECSRFGSPELVRRHMLDNFEAVLSRLPALEDRIGALERATRECLDASENDLDLRWRGGWIRECHGDLHLANLLQEPGRPIELFDCLEFSDTLRIIDTLSDVAFLLMDLDLHGRGDLHHRVLSQYLEAANDYMGLTLLRPYQAYRAMVRAKVAAIELEQARARDAAEEERRARQALESHLLLAEHYLDEQTQTPLLLLMHGVTGSGKSRLALDLVEALGAVRLRSDVERKRLLGLAPEDDTRQAGRNAYTPAMHRATYRRLLALAFGILDAGYPVIVDATFLRREYRLPFLQLAQRLGLPVRILHLTAPEAVLRERVVQRARAGSDPSEAGLEVLAHQMEAIEPLTEAERALAIGIDTTRPLDVEALAQELDAAHVTQRIPDVSQK